MNILRLLVKLSPLVSMLNDLLTDYKTNKNE